MTEKQQSLTVGRVAELVGVSVRTLHHWDTIDLVRPSGRSWSDYRLYDADDIARIHRVLVYREIGLPLAEIARILDDPEVDPREHLQRQRALLAERISRLTKAARAVDEMIERTTPMNQDKNIKLSPEEQTRIFGTDWDPAWQDEARERWGDSEQWAQSNERTGHYSASDWKRVAEETAALDADLAEAMQRGVEPGSEEANALAERHRASISQHYDCTASMHVVLARMYTEDPRFTAHYDRRAEGLAAWLRTVIEESARTQGVDPETAGWE
ncbi:MerR family transcriptional regulator [Brachybacterium muris]|uniref:MerR family transcriptional regulator n=1 Tax=Brachybacterium muris TaxID=219301 RepID=UPI00223AC6D1|nr:MerR family transcriptional regulator [Brachybacterium muris]MCT2178487.1 MerR family transcriptional regulator [Brachybacterium muris]